MSATAAVRRLSPATSGHLPAEQDSEGRGVSPPLAVAPLRGRRPCLRSRRDTPQSGLRGKASSFPVTALHSITSSARNNSDGGSVNCMARAARALITNSKRVG